MDGRHVAEGADGGQWSFQKSYCFQVCDKYGLLFHFTWIYSFLAWIAVIAIASRCILVIHVIAGFLGSQGDGGVVRYVCK